MRNDARPVGEDAPASPVGGDEQPSLDPPGGRPASDDARGAVKHDRRSPAESGGAEGDADSEDAPIA